MKDPIFYATALALLAGMAAQVAALRLGVPSIVLLLATGMAIGPDGLAVLDPTVFGHGRSDLVTLAVSIVLFEGSLALDLERMRHQQRSLVLLLTLGAAISFAGGTLAARGLLGLSWEVSVLYGAIMIVTGPTVVTPLLSRLVVDREVRELLIGEGVLIDPLGAIAAITAAEVVVGRQHGLTSGLSVLAPLVVGGAIGGVAGLGLGELLKRRWVPDHLTNPIVLAVVLAVSAGASRVSAEAGLMAAVAQGVVLANTRIRGLAHLREFKEELTVIFLSFLFVVLAAELRLAEVTALGWRSLAVVAALVWIARPVAVALSTLGSNLTWRQRAFVAWICPRGIVAAAVASLFADLLQASGVAGGVELEALVFVTVASTVVVQGLTAKPMTRLLRIDQPAMAGVIIVGADSLGRTLARLLRRLDRPAVLVDRSAAAVRTAIRQGLVALEGDALSPELLEVAGIRYAHSLLAMTRNPELNELIVRRARENFRVESALAIGTENGAPDGVRLFPGNFPGIDEVNRLLWRKGFVLAEYTVAEGTASGTSLAALGCGPNEFALVVQRGASTMIAASDLTLATGDHLWCLRPRADPSPLDAALTLVGTALPQEDPAAARRSSGSG